MSYLFIYKIYFGGLLCTKNTDDITGSCFTPAKISFGQYSNRGQVINNSSPVCFFLSSSSSSALLEPSPETQKMECSCSFGSFSLVSLNPTSSPPTFLTKLRFLVRPLFLCAISSSFWLNIIFFVNYYYWKAEIKPFEFFWAS